MLGRKILACVMVLAVMAGCRRDNDATPPKYGEVLKDDSDRSYRPIRIPDRKGDSVLGAIAAAEQVAAAEKRESAEGARIDDSSAEAIAKSLCEVSSSADWKSLSNVLVAEQADAFKAIEEPLVPFLTGVSHFAKAVSEKFEGKVIALQTQDAWLGQLLDLSGALTVQETPAGEEEAKVTLVVGPADAADAKKIELTAKKVENVWRLTLADFTPPTDAATVAAALEGKAAAFEDLASRVSSGEVADADAAKAEAGKIIEGSSKPAEASENNAEPGAENPGASIDVFIPLSRKNEAASDGKSYETITGLWKSCHLETVRVTTIKGNSVTFKSVKDERPETPQAPQMPETYQASQENELVDVEVHLSPPKGTVLVDFSGLCLVDSSGKPHTSKGFGPDGFHIYYKLDNGMGVVEKSGEEKLLVMSYSTASPGQVHYLADEGATAPMMMYLLFEVPAGKGPYKVASTVIVRDKNQATIPRDKTVQRPRMGSN